MDLASVLQNAQSPNSKIRNQAEAYLNQAVEAQYGPCLLALTVELATESRPAPERQLAGLYIKNLITATDDTILERKTNQWLQCDPSIKSQIRAGFLETIKSPVQVVSHTAAQILAAYGAVDVPRNVWPDLLVAIFNNITSAEIHDVTKVASLEALGYMCNLMSPEAVDDNELVKQIVSAIIDGMRADRRNDVRLAAVTALNNSLDFTSQNFENQVERNAIMQAICEATQASEVKIRERAYECLATIADLYYDKLQPYAATIFNLTLSAISKDNSAVGMQAIELWRTICGTEINLLADIKDGDANVSDYLKLTEVAAPSLTPLLLQCMTKQKEGAGEDDTWNISIAAAALLEDFARTIENSIVPVVLPFITENINNANWRLKEAALMAFGMILDGPTGETLSPLVVQAMPILITCLRDSNTLVRGASAWTIGRICELHKSCLSNDILPHMVVGLNASLEDPSSKVVSQACFAMHNLSKACSDESDANSNVLSHFMPQMLTKLLAITVREDWEQDNIRDTAFEAINMMVANSAVDMQPIVVQLLSEALTRLEQSFHPSVNTQERMNLQSCLCSLVGAITKKLETEHVTPFADRIMTVLLKVFETKGAVAHKDAFVAIGFVAEKLGSNFLRYLSFIEGPLLLGLKSFDEHQLVTVAVGVVGDLCRALGTALLPSCDEIVRCLLELLQSQVLNRAVKPHVISLFADIAMAIEGDFDRYMDAVLLTLKQFGEANTNSDDEDLVAYIKSLRNSILEAYTGIVQGLKAANKQDTVLPFVEGIEEFLQRAHADPDKTVALRNVFLQVKLNQAETVTKHELFRTIRPTNERHLQHMAALSVYLGKFRQGEASCIDGRLCAKFDDQGRICGLSLRDWALAHQSADGTRITFLPLTSTAQLPQALHPGTWWVMTEDVLAGLDIAAWRRIVVENRNEVVINSKKMQALVCYRLPTGTVLPEGLQLIADNDPPGHSLLCPIPGVPGPEAVDEVSTIFVPSVASLPWGKHRCILLSAGAEPKPLAVNNNHDPRRRAAFDLFCTLEAALQYCDFEHIDIFNRLVASANFKDGFLNEHELEQLIALVGDILGAVEDADVVIALMKDTAVLRSRLPAVYTPDVSAAGSTDAEMDSGESKISARSTNICHSPLALEARFNSVWSGAQATIH